MNFHFAMRLPNLWHQGTILLQLSVFHGVNEETAVTLVKGISEGVRSQVGLSEYSWDEYSDGIYLYWPDTRGAMEGALARHRQRIVQDYRCHLTYPLKSIGPKGRIKMQSLDLYTDVGGLIYQESF